MALPLARPRLRPSCQVLVRSRTRPRRWSVATQELRKAYAQISTKFVYPPVRDRGRDGWRVAPHTRWCHGTVSHPRATDAARGGDPCRRAEPGHGGRARWSRRRRGRSFGGVTATESSALRRFRGLPGVRAGAPRLLGQSGVHRPVRPGTRDVWTTPPAHGGRGIGPGDRPARRAGPGPPDRPRCPARVPGCRPGSGRPRRRSDVARGNRPCDRAQPRPVAAGRDLRRRAATAAGGAAALRRRRLRRRPRIEERAQHPAGAAQRAAAGPAARTDRRTEGVGRRGIRGVARRSC